MDKIEDVKKILGNYTYQFQPDFDEKRGARWASGDIAQQINQLYNSPDWQKEGFTKTVSRYNEPDQPRLLTDWELLSVIPAASPSKKGVVKPFHRRIAKAQRDLTASIKDAEIEAVKEFYKLAGIAKDTVNAAHIGALLKEIEYCPKCGNYIPKAQPTKKCFSCDWELKANPTSEVEG